MSQKDDKRSANLRMPAEWEPHEATWLAWPHEREDWPGKFAPIPWVYAEIVRHLSRVERVYIAVQGRTMREHATRRLEAHGANLDRGEFVSDVTDRVCRRD